MEWFTLADAADVPVLDRSKAVALANFLLHNGQEIVAPLTKDVIDTPRLVTTDSGMFAWPEVDGAIVRFQRFEPGSGKTEDNWCFVLNWRVKSIVDSIDGQVKPASEYGAPVSWMTCEIAEILPPESTIYKHNVVDGIEYDSYGTPQRMYVSNPKGADLIEYGGTIVTFRDFRPVPEMHLSYGAEVRIMGTAHHPLRPLGIDFLVPMAPMDSWGEFTRSGHPAKHQGFKLGDLSDSKPPALPVSNTPAVAQNKPPEAVLLPKPTDFHYLREDQQPVYYRVLKRLDLKSLTDPEAQKITVLPGTLDNPRNVKILGWFSYDGRTYLLPVLTGGADPFKWYYGIIEVGPDGRRFIEKIPDKSDVPDDGSTTDEEKRYLKSKRYNVADVIVDLSSLFELTLVRGGILKLKRHVERIKTWKQ